MLHDTEMRRLTTSISLEPLQQCELSGSKSQRPPISQKTGGQISAAEAKPREAMAMKRVVVNFIVAGKWCLVGVWTEEDLQSEV